MIRSTDFTTYAERDAAFDEACKQADEIAIWCSSVQAFQYMTRHAFRYNKYPEVWQMHDGPGFNALWIER